MRRTLPLFDNPVMGLTLIREEPTSDLLGVNHTPHLGPIPPNIVEVLASVTYLVNWTVNQERMVHKKNYPENNYQLCINLGEPFEVILVRISVCFK